MTIEQIKHALAEARRFIEAAGVARNRITASFPSPKAWAYGSVSSPETAACRRASMDLTRALADLRRTAKWLRK